MLPGFKVGWMSLRSFFDGSSGCHLQAKFSGSSMWPGFLVDHAHLRFIRIMLLASDKWVNLGSSEGESWSCTESSLVWNQLISYCLEACGVQRFYCQKVCAWDQLYVLLRAKKSMVMFNIRIFHVILHYFEKKTAGKLLQGWKHG